MLKYPEKSYGKVYKGEGNENIIGNRLLHLSVMINLAPSLLQQRLCKFCPVAQLIPFHGCNYHDKRRGAALDT